jgi:hypothetical protein
VLVEEGKGGSKKNTEYGARTHDHTVKSRALFQLS